MPTVTAAGYNRVANSAQAYQPVINRHVWDVKPQANGDKVLLARLPAGHRIIPELTSVIANGATPALTYDLCVGVDGNKLITGDAVTAVTFKRTGTTAYALVETLGVDMDNDRDVYLLLPAAPATAGGKVILQLASAPQSSVD